MANQTIKVNNNAKANLKVAISKWEEGDPSFFKIPYNENVASETWSRPEGRGFILAAKYEGAPTRAYSI